MSQAGHQPFLEFLEPTLPPHEKQDAGGPLPGKFELVGQFVADECAGDAVHKFYEAPSRRTCRADNQRRRVDQTVRHEDRLHVGRRLAHKSHPTEFHRLVIIAKQYLLRDTEEPCRIAPDIHKTVLGHFVKIPPQRLAFLQQQSGKGRRSEGDLRGADRHSLGIHVPIL